MSHSVDIQHLSHAYIFNCNDGLPGLALALAFAQDILCEARVEGRCCGECSSCKTVGHLSHPDLHFSFPIVKPGTGKNADCDLYMNEWLEFLAQHQYPTIADWRESIRSGNKQQLIPTAEGDRILKRLNLKSYKGGYKVLILWQPERFNNETANKMLKLIEEPNDKTIIILVSHALDSILPTINSRCQTITLEPIFESDLHKHLLSKGITPDKNLISLSNGNIGRYFRFVNQEKDLRANETTFFQWLSLCYHSRILELYQMSEEFGKLGRDDQKVRVSAFMELVRVAYNHKELKGKGSLTDLSELAPVIHSGNIQRIFKVLEDLLYHIERNAKANLCFFESSMQLNQLISRKPFAPEGR